MTTKQSGQCHVCGDATDDLRLVSECLNCTETFHLNPYSTGEHRDCGDAMIGPSGGVEFWCNPCLGQLEEDERAAGGDDPRATLDRLAGVHQLRPPRPPRPAASDSTPPPRRGRSNVRRRYRRIDGA